MSPKRRQTAGDTCPDRLKSVESERDELAARVRRVEGLLARWSADPHENTISDQAWLDLRNALEKPT